MPLAIEVEVKIGPHAYRTTTIQSETPAEHRRMVRAMESIRWTLRCVSVIDGTLHAFMAR